MDLKQIERLMQAMARAGMKRIALKQEGFEIELEREGPPGGPAPFEVRPHLPSYSHGMPAPMYKDEPKETVTAQVDESSGAKFITSPMVGTFYSASSPDAPPFIKVGDIVEEGSVVCIIEAMKVMNEVKSGQKGRVTEVLHKNGDPVEFGTKLFKIA